MELVNLLDLDVVKVSREISDYSLMITASSGYGKAQPLDALVLSENGYVKMGNIKVGDKVFGEDGELHNVIGVYPQGNKEIYEVVFSDGTSTECCKEHMWTIQTPSDRCNGKFRNMSLEEIMEKQLYKISSGYKRWQYYIPMVNPIRFKKQNFKIEPYILGLLIGDGYLASGSIEFTNTEPDILKEFQDYFRTTRKNEITLRVSDGCGAVRGELDRLGLRCVSDEKFIPEIYKYNSVDVRLDILRGLIDTDGHVCGSSVEFSTSSLQLAEDVKFVAESLGCTARIVTKEQPYYLDCKGNKVYCKDNYRVLIKQPLGLKVFSSEKHNSKFKEGQTKARRYIKEIKKLGVKPAQCIKVDNPSNLYVTNNFIVTHNTPFLAELYGERALILSFENSQKGIAGAHAVQIDSYETLIFYLGQLQNPKVREKFDVIIIDTLFLLDYCCEKSVTDAYGKDLIGDCLKWNKAYKIVDKRFLTVIKTLQKMNYSMVYVCHPVEKKVKAPNGQEYIKLEPKVSDRIKDLLLPEIDIRLFATYDNEGNKVIYTKGTPHFDARCRVGDIDSIIPFNAEALKKAFAEGVDRKVVNKNLIVDNIERKNMAIDNERNFEEVMNELVSIGQELEAAGLGMKAQQILSSELGCDDEGNQRTLANVNEKMKPALEVIIIKLKELKSQK